MSSVDGPTRRHWAPERPGGPVDRRMSSADRPTVARARAPDPSAGLVRGGPVGGRMSSVDGPTRRPQAPEVRGGPVGRRISSADGPTPLAPPLALAPPPTHSLPALLPQQ